jgi:CRISPR-associated endonuclease Csn1
MKQIEGHGAYRIGIDLGTNSLGWCVLDLDADLQPVAICDMGVRIFSSGRDPKSGASLAVDRRNARAARRRRDRYLGRRSALMNALIAGGLMPDDEADRKALEGLDPYALRANGLDAALPLYHVGRAIFHLNQRRGFKSNRKADRGKDDEKGKIATGVSRLREAMADTGSRTLGEFLHKRRISAQDPRRVPAVRTRLRPERGPDAKGDGYDFYAERALLEEEFDTLWSAQARFHRPSKLPETLRNRLRDIIFFQRRLKEPEVGRCTFFDDKRLAKSHPLFQERRLYEEVNALEIEEAGKASRKLTRDERDKLIFKLQNARTASFDALRKFLKLPADARFNKESENRSKLLGDEVRAELSHKDRFGPRWSTLELDMQSEVVRKLRDEPDEGALVDWLTHEFGFDAARAKAVAGARLPEGYGRLGEKATRLVLDQLKADVVTYDKAVARCGEQHPEMAHHSDFRTGEVLDALPYYAVVLERHVPPGTNDPLERDEAVRYGRITNPTVHIGLNQLRRVVNAIIGIYGSPAQIVVELARELKLNEEQKRTLNRELGANTREAERRSKALEELGYPASPANRAFLKLWEELNPDNPLDRRCVYTGRQISLSMLFNGEADVDHILPRSRTLDDSNANKIICIRESNREKRNRSPYEAFGHDEARWAEIADRAARLPKNKRWRFQPDAMERFENEERDFLDRQLVDTQYLSRISRQYLEAVCPTVKGSAGGVWVIPGRMTQMLRGKWGLNSLLPDHNLPLNTNKRKNRLDHRHHAIDAAVIGVTDRKLLNRIQKEAGRAEADGLREHNLGDIEPPWPGFREDIGAKLDSLAVSHRPDHGKITPLAGRAGKDQTAGKLHNDTAYGLTGETDEKGNEVVVVRKPVEALKARADLNRIRDQALRGALEAATQGLTGKEFEAAVRNFADSNPTWPGLRRVRMTEPLKTIQVKDRKGMPYKGFKGDANLRYDVWELPDGKWMAEIVTMFDAHQAGSQSKVKENHPTARKAMRLHQNDMLAFEHEGGTMIGRVVKFSVAGTLVLAGHAEAGSLKARDAMSSDIDPFKYINASASALKKRKARKIRIDEIGRIHDPGPPR